MALAYRWHRGDNVIKSCRLAADILRDVTEEFVAARIYFIFATYSFINFNQPMRGKPMPAVKVSSDNVRLSYEYESGKSVLDEESDLVQYYRYSAERGSSHVDAQIAMGNVNDLHTMLRRNGN